MTTIKYGIRSGTVKAGWIKISRQIFENTAIGAKPYCETAAWLWLIVHAAWEDGPQLERSELFISRRDLAQKWGWTDSAVRHFLRRLEAEKMVKIQRPVCAQPATKLTVCNYDKYQDRAPSQQPKLRPLYKEGKKFKNLELSKDSSCGHAALLSLPEALSRWNAMAEKAGLPKVVGELSDKRRTKLLLRLEEHKLDG